MILPAFFDQIPVVGGQLWFIEIQRVANEQLPFRNSQRRQVGQNFREAHASTITRQLSAVTPKIIHV